MALIEWHCCEIIAEANLLICPGCGRCPGCGGFRGKGHEFCPQCKAPYCPCCGKCPGCSAVRYRDITELCACGHWRAAPEQVEEMEKDNAVAGRGGQTAWGRKSRTGCLGIFVVAVLMTVGWILVAG